MPNSIYVILFGAAHAGRPLSRGWVADHAQPNRVIFRELGMPRKKRNASSLELDTPKSFGVNLDTDGLLDVLTDQIEAAQSTPAPKPRCHRCARGRCLAHRS